MIILYLNCIITIFCFPIALFNDKILKKATLIFLYLYFWLCIAFQNGSPDLPAYKLIYEGEFTRNIEPLYQLFGAFFHNFLGVSFRFFWIILGTLSVILFAYLNNFYSKDKLLSALLFMNLYFPLKQLTQIRNLLSIYLFLLAGTFLIQKNKKNLFRITYLCSGLTHYSGFGSIIAFKDNEKIIKFFNYCFIFSIVFLIYPISKLIHQLLEPLTHLNSGIAYYIAWFVADDFMGKTLFHIVRILCMVFFCFINMKYFDKKTRLLYRFFIISCIIRFMFSSIGMLALRFSEVYSFTEIFLFPNIIYNEKNRKYKILYTAIFLVYSILILFLFFKNNESFIETYHFV